MRSISYRTGTINLNSETTTASRELAGERAFEPTIVLAWARQRRPSPSRIEPSRVGPIQRDSRRQVHFKTRLHTMPTRERDIDTITQLASAVAQCRHLGARFASCLCLELMRSDCSAICKRAPKWMCVCVSLAPLAAANQISGGTRHCRHHFTDTNTALAACQMLACAPQQQPAGRLMSGSIRAISGATSTAGAWRVRATK